MFQRNDRAHRKSRHIDQLANNYVPNAWDDSRWRRVGMEFVDGHGIMVDAQGRRALNGSFVRACPSKDNIAAMSRAN